MDGTSMERAALVTAYLKTHMRKMAHSNGCGPASGPGPEAVEMDPVSGEPTVPEADAHQALKGTFKRVDDIEPVLTLLEKHGFIRPELSGQKRGPGRSPSPYYEVNPHAAETDSQNPQNTPDDDENDDDEDGNDNHGTTPPPGPTPADGSHAPYAQNSQYPQNSPTGGPAEGSRGNSEDSEDIEHRSGAEKPSTVSCWRVERHNAPPGL